MAVVPVLPPVVAGGVYPSSSVSALVVAVFYAMNPPRFQVRQTVAQSLANNVWTSLNFDVEDVDDDPSHIGGHSTSVNTSRFTAVYPGWYRMGGCSSNDANVTGIRGARWAVNGSALNIGGTVMNATTASIVVIPAPADLVFLNVGDYVELQGLQTSGGALNVSILATAQATMNGTWESN